MRLARVLGAIGRTLITAGVLILLFVAYQLWGTGIHEARSQRQLESDFEERLRTTTTTSPSRSSTTSTVPLPTPPPAGGDAVAHLVIPKIGLDKIVVEGVALSQLKKGPGHYPDTPLPGQPGNAAIAGHRTTYGAPFGNLDQLAPGDEILVTTLQGEFRYEVMEQPTVKGTTSGWFVVAPTQVEVLNDMGDNRLTLTACHPKFSARQRIIVTAELRDRPAPIPQKIDLGPVVRDSIDENPDGEQAEKMPAVLLGLAAALVWLGAWVVGQFTGKRWRAYAAGLPVFLVLLFFFFESFARLLPSNY